MACCRFCFQNSVSSSDSVRNPKLWWRLIEARMEGTDRIYETPIYESMRLSVQMTEKDWNWQVIRSPCSSGNYHFRSWGLRASWSENNVPII